MPARSATATVRLLYYGKYPISVIGSAPSGGVEPIRYTSARIVTICGVEARARAAHVSRVSRTKTQDETCTQNESSELGLESSTRKIYARKSINSAASRSRASDISTKGKYEGR